MVWIGTDLKNHLVPKKIIKLWGRKKKYVIKDFKI